MPRRTTRAGGAAGASGSDLSPTTLRREIEALEGLDLYELRARWQVYYRTPAPRFFRRQLLIRAIAYEVQAKVYGGLASKTRRLLLRIAKEAEAGKGFTTATMTQRLRPGTRLVRAHKGVTHVVDVLEDGFAWNGARWGSLSPIARAITGTNWNGNAFFGLRRKKTGPKPDA